MLTEDTGKVEAQAQAPRDRQGTFEPQIVKKRQRPLTGIAEMVLSLYAKGLTTGERKISTDHMISGMTVRS